MSTKSIGQLVREFIQERADKAETQELRENWLAVLPENQKARREKEKNQ